MNVPAGVVEGMRDYCARRAAYYERVSFKPERQADLRAMEREAAIAALGSRAREPRWIEYTHCWVPSHELD